MIVQPSLFDLYPCDICNSTGEARTAEQRRCRVCGGSGTLDYDPAETMYGDAA